MERLCRYLALAVVATAATLATVNATFRLPWIRDLQLANSLATYNAALFPAGPPEMEERTNLLIQQLRRSTADVFCLQEVWLTETQRKIYQGVKDRYQYIVSPVDLTPDPSNDTTPACSVAGFQAFATCSVIQCTNATGVGLLSCLLQNCQPALRELSSPCLYCLLFTTRGQQCLTDSASLYGSTYGLMLLSKKRLSDIKVEPFQSEGTGQIRAYIQARVSGIGDVMCTHLTTALAPVYGGPPFSDPLQFSTYDEQQYDEILKLFNGIENLQTPVFLGDFNHGPAPPGITWFLPFHYGLMNARGLVSPYALADGRCTWCVSNPLVTAQGFTENLVIDHVYVTTAVYKRVKTVKRIFDNISTANGIPLSDHYGVQLSLWRKFWGTTPATSGLLPLAPPQTFLDELCAAASD